MFASQYSKIILAGAVLVLAGAFAPAANATHSWGGYHWARTAHPFTLKLGANISTTWGSYLGVASSDWSQSSVLDTTIVPGLSSARTCKPTAGRVEVCNRTYGYNGWLGVASIWVNGSHITQGTVKMNDTYFNTGTYNKPSWRQMVMCQEVGHTFGLDHQDENFYNLNLGTCMDYTNDPARNDGAGDNLHPNQHDYDMLETIYAHLDTSTTVAAALPTSPKNSRREDDIGNDTRDFGRELKRSGDGRVSLYELDLGNGDKVLTHVLWADEIRDQKNEARGQRNETRDETRDRRK